MKCHKFCLCYHPLFANYGNYLFDLCCYALLVGKTGLLYRAFVKFYINWAFKQWVIYISSDEDPSQNQWGIGGVAYKLYIHTQTFEFYQCRTNSTFIFQLSMWDKPPTFTTPTHLLTCALLRKPYTCTQILIKREWWQIKIEQSVLIPY